VAFGDPDIPSLVPLTFAGSPSKSVDEVLVEHGRSGGPSRYGWHTRELGWRCPRAAAYVRNGQAGPGVGKAAWIGSVVHEYLASYYTSRSSLEPRRTPLEHAHWVDDVHHALIDEGYVEVADESRRLYDGYLVEYGRDDWYFRHGTVVGVEEEISAVLPWGEPYSARLDMRIVGPSGTLVVDHKVTARRDSRFLSGWRVSPQMLGIQWLGRKLGWVRPINLSINGIIRIQKPVYLRRDITHHADAVRDWLRMMHYHHLLRRFAEAAGDPPDFAQCYAGFQPCPFIDFCAYGIPPAQAAARYAAEEADEVEED